ncbi:hypothetical protein SKAU_G00124480 [Synaphobranchus kaupii]|uniref:Uncharacterized protein n=1 Tax=Synaphobranchus kaupii TaxID=118154 RepID=A0A9Q1J0L4_SYNKA|nr:hypothetical protein SKAU_G00124480 [Synaphobranchus kaupii]
MSPAKVLTWTVPVPRGILGHMPMHQSALQASSRRSASGSQSSASKEAPSAGAPGEAAEREGAIRASADNRAKRGNRGPGKALWEKHSDNNRAARVKILMAANPPTTPALHWQRGRRTTDERWEPCQPAEGTCTVPGGHPFAPHYRYATTHCTHGQALIIYS